MASQNIVFQVLNCKRLLFLQVWTAPGMQAKDANKLPQMVDSGEANRVDLVEPVTLTGHINFY